jgi:hypothetical protein
MLDLNSLEPPAAFDHEVVVTVLAIRNRQFAATPAKNATISSASSPLSFSVCAGMMPIQATS